MAMSRSRGASRETSRSPIQISPSLTSSSPAIMRSSVDLPQPDGPTRTMNSPLSIVRLTLVDGAHVAREDLRHPLELDLGHAPRSLRSSLTAPGIVWHCRSAVNVLSNPFQDEARRGGDRRPRRTTECPTITTVARLANVSVASASRVMNGIRTNPDTFERVTEAAEAVGYVPNAAARSLRSRRTGQIAFAMPDVGNPVYTTMVGSIQEVARAHGLASDAPLDRRRRRGRARDGARPEAPLRRRADPRLARPDGHTRQRARAARRCRSS